MIELLLGAAFLAGVTGYAKKQRDKYYSITCPKCGKVIHPSTTGTMDGRTHLTNYKYKCSCGYRRN